MGGPDQPMGPFRLGHGPGPHGDTAVSILSVVLHFVIWALVILAVIWIVRELVRLAGRPRALPPAPPNPAVGELDMLYARGEVTREEYLTRRSDLAGYSAPGAVPPTR